MASSAGQPVSGACARVPPRLPSSSLSTYELGSLDHISVCLSSCHSMTSVLSRRHDRVLQRSRDRGYLQRSKLQTCTPDVPSKPLAHCRSQTRAAGFRRGSRRTSDPPGNQLEALGGGRRGRFSIRINQRYRICFIWPERGPAQVEIVDYD